VFIDYRYTYNINCEQKQKTTQAQAHITENEIYIVQLIFPNLILFKKKSTKYI
jgi:hypothetical protein